MTDLTDKKDGKDWARAIMRRVGKGHAILPAVATMARQALGISTVPENAEVVMQRARERAK